MELESALNRLGDEADQAVADPEHRRDLLGRILFGLYNILLLAAAPVVLAILFGKKRCRSGLVMDRRSGCMRFRWVRPRRWYP